MPTYAFSCTACGESFDEIRPMSESGNAAICPDCGKPARQVPTAPAAVRGDAYDWSTENRGKGRRISQLDPDTKTPFYAKSQSAAIDEAHRRGLHAIKA